MSPPSVAVILHRRMKAMRWRRDGCDDSLVTASRPANVFFESFLCMDTPRFSAIAIAARMAKPIARLIFNQLVASTRSSKQVGYWTAN